MIARRELRDKLGTCSAGLSPRRRRLLRLRYQNDLTFTQIALAMKVTEDAVIKMHKRTLDDLRDGLAKMRIRKLHDIL
jgi:RNA polymerase sigma factor (sigma-70 family)